MKNPFLILASLFGAIGVALGALGAHALKAKMQEGLMTADQLNAWDTGSKYQLFHALVLLFVFFLFRQNNSKLVKASGWLFTVGIVFFSGSIYLLSTQNISGISFRFLGPVTPLGGILLIAGWVLLLVEGIRANKN